MNLFKSLILFLPLFLIYSCSTAPPSWVDSRPNDPDYWHGLGFASYIQSNDPKTLAKESAIHEISSQIKVNISSELDIVVTDFNGSVDNAISSVMKSRVNLLLPELEFIGHHSTKDGIHFYARLNKDKYKQAMIRLRSNSKNAALGYIRDADRNYGIQSFYLIQKAWQEIFPFNDEPVEVSYENQNVYLYSLIKQKLEEFNERLFMTATLEKEIVKTLVDRENSIIIKVKDRQTGADLNGVPVKIILPDKEVSLFSDKNGMIQYVLNGVSIASTFEILFELNTIELLKELNNANPILPFKPKVNSISMKVVPAKVSIKSTEKNLNKIMKRKILEPSVKGLFNKQLEFVIDNPDFYIVIDANTIKKSEKIGENYPYFTFGNATVSFQDAKTNEEFLNFIIDDIKGADFGSQRIAGIRAYEKMEVELLNKFQKTIYD